MSGRNSLWQKPKAQTGKIKEFRKKGFEHAIICSMAAGMIVVEWVSQIALRPDLTHSALDYRRAEGVLR
ncbi:hypothetical protein PI125_g17649 [Phytophthora idaei]|nr:hypothetical protein PI125_g17649 [Phytophthora idaei]